MKHYASPSFWTYLQRLPQNIQKIAKRNFELLKENPAHPSLHYKKVGKFCSVRIGMRYRALGIETENGLLWFWIGSHSEYDKLISQ